MKGYVSENDLEKVQVDQTVSIKVNSSDKKMTGRISYVSDRPTTTNTKEMKDNLSYYEVDISFEDQEGLVNGFHVDADLEIVSNEYKVPTTAVSDISVENGQEVNDGDLLFTTKDNSVIEQINVLKSQLTSLNSQKSRLSKNNKDNVNNDAIASINTQISSVEAQISALNSSAYVKNTAPFAGKVYINDQNSTDMSTSFISLVSNEFFMKGYVSEDDLEKVQIDQTVSIKVNSSDKKMTGRISYVSDRPTTTKTKEMGYVSEDDLEKVQIDQTVSIKVNSSDKKMTGRISYVSDRPTTTKTKEMKDNLSYYEVDISFEDQEGLVNGFHVDADLEIVSNEYKVPTTAVLKSGDSAYVMKDLDGILKKQEVSIVKTGKNVTKIVTNLEPGDKILKHPDKAMKEGDAIPSAGLVDKSPKIDPEELKIPDVNGQIEE